MRFLYGDSTPFPLGYNFLATLEAFMTAATRIVQLEQESRELSRQAEELAQNRVKGLEALEQFHTVVMRAVQDTAQKVKHAHALEYASRVADFASRYVEEHRRTTLGSSERESAQCKTENDRRTVEQRKLLDGFLKVAKLPVGSTKYSVRMTGEAKDARYQISAMFENPDGIQTVFLLGAAKVPAWGAPRKVADIVQGVDLLVGVDKSWLRGTVTPKQINVDEWLITHVDIAPDMFELHLRKKLVEKEELHFKLRRTEAGLVGKVEHPGHPNAEALPSAVGQSDLAMLERVWQALTVAMREVVEHKEQLLAVSLDGNNVFDGGLVVQFVVRLVAMFGPTVREIAKRSPNEFELTLKQETDGGRREELYLRRDQLASQLQPLASVGREVFAPLGLDSWVPGVTSVPPPVVAAGPPASMPPRSAAQPASLPPSLGAAPASIPVPPSAAASGQVPAVGGATSSGAVPAASAPAASAPPPVPPGSNRQLPQS